MKSKTISTAPLSRSVAVKIKIALLSTILSVSACAKQAGQPMSLSSPQQMDSAGREGNGGGAFICPDPSQSVFLDLFEAKIAGLQIPASEDTVQNQIQAAFNRLNPVTPLYSKMLAVYAEVKAATIIPIPTGTQITWPSDENNPLQMTGCQPTGILLYNDANNSILVDEQSLASLAPTQQAAAWVHETVYKFFREVFQSTDSVIARQVVGNLFSNESDITLVDNLLQIANLHVRPVNFSCDVASNGEKVCILGPSSINNQQFTFSVTYVPAADADPACITKTAFQIDPVRTDPSVTPPLGPWTQFQGSTTLTVLAPINLYFSEGGEQAGSFTIGVYAGMVGNCSGNVLFSDQYGDSQVFAMTNKDAADTPEYSVGFSVQANPL